MIKFFDIQSTLRNISLFSHLLPLILFLFVSRKNKGVGLGAILCYSAYSFLNDIFIFLSEPLGVRHLVFHSLSLFTIIEYLLFSFAIFSILKTLVLKKIILFVSPLFIAFSIIQYIQASNDYIDSISITVENIIIIVFCMLYFFEEISTPQVSFVYSTTSFWLIVGILIYSTGTFFLFMFSENLSDDEWEKWSIINYVFTILKNVCFCIAVTIKSNSHNLPSYENLDNDLIDTPLTFKSNP